MKDVLHRALELPYGQRSAFLDRVCTNDSMRRELDSLLSASDEVCSAFLRSAGAYALLTPRTQIGDYEVVAFIGAGGMGTVYRAHDPRLRRDVAIKMLPAFVKSDTLKAIEQSPRDGLSSQMGI